MPKDPPRNQPNYKIGGYHLNEYEYAQNHGAITEEHEQLPRQKHNATQAEFRPEDASHGDDRTDEAIENSGSAPDVDVDSPS